MTLQKYLKKKGVTLVPWQEDAANDFLEHVNKFKERSSGKSFLMIQLADFIEVHGNDFEVQR